MITSSTLLFTIIVLVVIAVGAILTIRKNKSTKNQSEELPNQVDSPVALSKDTDSTDEVQFNPSLITKKTHVNQDIRKMSLIRKRPAGITNCEGCDAELLSETVLLATYEVAHYKEIGSIDYLRAVVLACPTCRYICVGETELLEIKGRAKPRWIDIQPWIQTPSIRSAIKPATAPVEKESEKPFKWPSTYAIETLKSAPKAVTYKHESELHKLGYQLSSNLSRHRRWVILETEALPKLGLEKVANTIAANVRQRKRQRGGARKYANAIKEWEHDLSELKKHYYRWDFIWPHTS